MVHITTPYTICMSFQCDSARCHQSRNTNTHAWLPWNRPFYWNEKLKLKSAGWKCEKDQAVLAITTAKAWKTTKSANPNVATNKAAALSQPKKSPHLTYSGLCWRCVCTGGWGCSSYSNTPVAHSITYAPRMYDSHCVYMFVVIGCTCCCCC